VISLIQRFQLNGKIVGTESRRGKRTPLGLWWAIERFATVPEILEVPL